MNSAALVLASLCSALGADSVGGQLSLEEAALLERAKQVPKPERRKLSSIRSAIKRGADPLGEMCFEMRDLQDRRSHGVFYTDRPIVTAMMGWVASQGAQQVVDCGSGSGRFAFEAARLPGVTSVVAVELDALSCLVIRANAAVRKVRTINVLNADFTKLDLPTFAGRRAFVGNPPYVRHHDLSQEQKALGRSLAASVRVGFSGLSGLHAYFVLKAAALATEGDVLCFITSAEWLDVNYGQGMRDLFLDGLRAERVHLLDSSTAAFTDAATTAVIVCARSGGSAEATLFKAASTLSSMLQFQTGGHSVAHSTLANARTWSRIARQNYPAPRQDSSVPLGSFMRVHRGVVTGANDFFVLSKSTAAELGIIEWCRPVISSAEEVLDSAGVVRDNPQRRVMLCPEEDVDPSKHRALASYLALGVKAGVPNGYVCSHRKQWWRPQAHAAPPIVATYMARQAPAFALNPDGLLLLNVAHGLYPIAPLSPERLEELAESLNKMRESYRGSGRTYHGGLEKFEPKEMERLTIELPPDRVAMLCDG